MRTYAIAGTSGRALRMYARTIIERFADSAKLVGLFDVNLARASYFSHECDDVPVFDDFDEMIRVTHPDCVIVTTMDRYHHEYIIRSLDAGCDVITEKPMTIDDEKVRAVLAAEKRNGRKIIVTFNYRFAPYTTRVKELLREGAIGQPLSVDFEWILDTSHGADYFRRWHRRKENSGGLFVHKATHHFDMVNWWLEDEPSVVFANGERRFYGPTRAERGDRCSTCSFTRTCEFYVDFRARPDFQGLYFGAEHSDGYHRDGCVFSDEIDIEDTMSATVRYNRNTLLTYSLIAHSPYEGWSASLSGTNGRMEVQEFHSGHSAKDPSNVVKVFNRKGEIVSYDILKAAGMHGGGDQRLLERLFSGCSDPDPLGHMADSRAGAMSCLIGIAANKSIATGEAVKIGSLLEGV